MRLTVFVEPQRNIPTRWVATVLLPQLLMTFQCMRSRKMAIMVIFLWTQMDFGQPVKILIQILKRCTVMMTLIILLGTHLQKDGSFGMMMLRGYIFVDSDGFWTA